jgi:hypothetical protein
MSRNAAGVDEKLPWLRRLRRRICSVKKTYLSEELLVPDIPGTNPSASEFIFTYSASVVVD